MNRVFLFTLLVTLSGLYCSAAPTPDHGYGAPAASYGAPAYKPSYQAPAAHGGAAVHHHYHYSAPAPVAKPTYHAPARPQYHAPAPQYHAPAPQYHAPQPYYPTRSAPSHGYAQEDPYIHLHKEELTRSALLLGAGIIKGVVITGLINSANNGITIG